MSKCNCRSYNKGVGEIEECVIYPPENMSGLDTNGNGICVDACIVHVISFLWSKGVVTLGSCCGHNENKPTIIVSNGKWIDSVDEIKKLISEVDNRDFDILSWNLINIDTGEKWKPYD